MDLIPKDRLTEIEGRYMKARISLTSAERKALDKEIEKQLAEWDIKHMTELSALILYVLHSTFGFGKKRLKDFYFQFADEIFELTQRYDLDDSDDVWLCTKKLKEYGIDLPEWEKELRGDNH